MEPWGRNAETIQLAKVGAAFAGKPQDFLREDPAWFKSGVSEDDAAEDFIGAGLGVYGKR